MRQVLPNRRPSDTHKFYANNGTPVYVSIGKGEAGTVQEVFVKAGKSGSTLNTVINAWAMSISLALQYGIPLADIINSHKDFIEGDESKILSGTMQLLKDYGEIT